VSGQLHAPVALAPEKETVVPLDWRLGGPQSHSGSGGEKKNSQLPPRIEPYNHDRPARSPALYRLSYHGSVALYQFVTRHLNLDVGPQPEFDPVLPELCDVNAPYCTDTEQRYPLRTSTVLTEIVHISFFSSCRVMTASFKGLPNSDFNVSLIQWYIKWLPLSETQTRNLPSIRERWFMDPHICPAINSPANRWMMLRN
jgi:hypothetical protein